jgi:hypothetical protein
LIPSVMVYRAAKWSLAPSFEAAFWDVLKIVSAFSVAHSLTLSLAVLGYAELPSKWVESAIAASVILAALNNVVPVWNRHRNLLAFSFGLIHGFGFASVLAGLQLVGASKLLSLFGFNLGVEAGQIILVFLFLPFGYLLSRYDFYQVAVLRSGSIVIAGIATVWLVERMFGFASPI